MLVNSFSLINGTGKAPKSLPELNCAWILSDFCSVREDNRKAKIGQGAPAWVNLERHFF